MSTRARTLHATLADTDPGADGAPNLWCVACAHPSCDWFQTGTYTYAANEPEALALAHAYGTTHEHRENRTHERRGTS